MLHFTFLNFVKKVGFAPLFLKVEKVNLFGTIKVVPEHLVRVIICYFWRTVVGIIIVCRLLKPSRDWGLGRIDIQEHHIRITLLNCVWILVTLGLVILPVISSHTNAWSCSHFHRSWKSVVVNMVHVRLYASYFAGFAGHNIHIQNIKQLFLSRRENENVVSKVVLSVWSFLPFASLKPFISVAETSWKRWIWNNASFVNRTQYLLLTKQML